MARCAFSRIWATTPAYRRLEADALSLSSSARESARSLCSSTLCLCCSSRALCLSSGSSVGGVSCSSEQYAACAW
eukprot:3730960-Amphidinium_carterae.1